MSLRGRMIHLYLLNGSATGTIKCTLPNWIGVIYKIPRTELKNCKDRKDLQHSGIYFLFGKSDDSGKNVVYVGQAGMRRNGKGLRERILEQARDPRKEYWTEAVVITTIDNSWGPPHINYLENRFTKLAVDAGRYVVKNGNTPNLGNISEEMGFELNDFIDYSKIVMGILGHKVFIPLDEATENSGGGRGTKLVLNQRGAHASGVQTSEGIVVCRGSRIVSTPTPSCHDWIKKLREANAGRINSDFVTTGDIVFNSPSAAAGFCVYGAINGRTAWTTEDGRTLKALEEGI